MTKKQQLFNWSRYSGLNIITLAKPTVNPQRKKFGSGSQVVFSGQESVGRVGGAGSVGGHKCCFSLTGRTDVQATVSFSWRLLPLAHYCSDRYFFTTTKNSSGLDLPRMAQYPQSLAALKALPDVLGDERLWAVNFPEKLEVFISISFLPFPKETQEKRSPPDLELIDYFPRSQILFI